MTGGETLAVGIGGLIIGAIIALLTYFGFIKKKKDTDFTADIDKLLEKHRVDNKKIDDEVKKLEENKKKKEAEIEKEKQDKAASMSNNPDAVADDFRKRNR